MEPISFASFTLASILASLPVNGETVTEPTITTHISPAIAGQWEIDLDSSITMTKDAKAQQAAWRDGCDGLRTDGRARGRDAQLSGPAWLEPWR